MINMDAFKSINISSYIGRYVNLKPAGKYKIGLCPFHDEKTPSFSVTDSLGIFHCFGCGVSGDIVEFAERYHNLTFRDAAKMLADEYGLDVESDENPELLAEYQRLAKESAEYKAQARRVTSFLLERGIDPSEADEFDLGYCEARNSLSIPLKDDSGRVVGFSFRRLDGEKPKYINSKNSKVFQKHRYLYLLDKSKYYIRESNEIVLVEGYFDAIKMFLNGIKNVVAVCGTAFTDDHVRVLSRYTSNFVFCFDGDAGGRGATLKSGKRLFEQGYGCKVIILPLNSDPDSFLRQKGLKRFLELPKKDFFYVYEMALSKQTDSKRKIIKELMSLLNESLINPVDKVEYMRYISEKYEIPLNYLTQGNSLERLEIGLEPIANNIDSRKKLEMEIISMLIESRDDVVEACSQYLDDSEISDSVLRDVYSMLVSESVPANSVLQFVASRDKKTASLLANYLINRVKPSDTLYHWQYIVKQLKVITYSARIDFLISRLDEISDDQQVSAIKRRIAELSHEKKRWLNATPIKVY